MVNSSGEGWIIQFYCNSDCTWRVSNDFANVFDSKEAADTFLNQQYSCGGLSNRNNFRAYKVSPKVKTKVDLKVTNKPQLSQVPYDALVYASKGFEYGCAPWKYKRGNYLIPTPDLLAAFDRLALYLDAGLRHLTKVTTAMNRARGCTDMADADLKAGAYAEDPESGLPHLVGGVCSIMMAIQQAVDAGLLPAELGQPWESRKPNA